MTVDPTDATLANRREPSALLVAIKGDEMSYQAQAAD
jgi:hypothetical protein